MFNIIRIMILAIAGGIGEYVTKTTTRNVLTASFAGPRKKITFKFFNKKPEPVVEEPKPKAE